MKNVMEYKGYMGVVEFSSDDGVFFGKLLGINDLITFEGETVRELEKGFREAVDDYLKTCSDLGKDPERAYKGSFNVRIDPDIHRKATFKAEALHISLNELVERAITKEVENLGEPYERTGHSTLPSKVEERKVKYRKRTGKKRGKKS